MKPRWFVLCVALTVVTVLPGLLDAQYYRPPAMCPGAMQVQTITMQWQNTYRYQQQQMQMQQMQMMPGMVGNAAATGQLLMTLKEALYPSQREWAAGALVSIDWRMQPQVVDALVLAAREDPAATVRATCVHSLAKMRCTTPTVVAVIQGLKSDADPRVRQEADQALVSLGVPQPASPVQPASAVEPEEKSESVISDQ